MNLSEIKPGVPFKALVYGRSKVGKTFGIGSFPRPNILDFDNGADTLLSPECISAYGYNPNIIVGRFRPDERDKNGVPTAHNVLDDATRYYAEWMSPQKKDLFDTWVIDTGTTLSEAAVSKGLILLGGPNAKRDIGITSNTHANARATGLVFPKLQDYGAERSMLEQFVLMVLGSGKNVILLCHEHEEYENDGQTFVGYRPLLRGGSKEVIGAHFSEIYRVFARPEGPLVKRLIQTVPVYKRDQMGSRLGIPNNTEWSWHAISAALNANATSRTPLKG